MDPNAKKKEQKEQFEKSFNDSLDHLSKILDGDEETIEKAMKGSGKKASAPSESAESSQSQEEEGSSASEVEEGKSPIKKSIESAVMEDPEAAVAVDVEPFLKSLMTAIDARLDDMERNLGKSMKYLHKKVKRNEIISKALGNTMRTAFDMQKAMHDTVEKIGNAPVQSLSVLRKSGERFEEDPKADAVSKMSKQDILSKALELRIKGQLAPMDVTLIEGRLNANLPLDPRHAGILAKSMSN